ncbi:MAG: gamma-glutamyltransferase, partial [Planctomycetota bacterium]
MRRSRLPLGKAVPLLLLLGGTLPAAGGAGTLANDQRASGKRGAVVTAHPIASQVGLEVLEKGGNAVDSAVAVFFALVLAVVHPQAGNLGGGGFMVARLMGAIRQESPREIALDFREVAPHRAERDMYLDERGKVVPGASLHTALAAGVPGSVAGICRAHELYGTLPFRDLLAPAIRLAEEGIEVDSFLHRAIAAKRKRFLAWRSTARIFLPGGKPPPVGSVFKQPELGKTLRRIARHGRDGFYRGETAGLIEREMQRSGGLIDREDLAAYEVKERKPLEGSYRGYRV